MKTTMDLPDAVMIELRERAASDGVPMRDIMLEALRRELARRSVPASRADFHFPVSSATGWLAGDLSLARAIEVSQR
ncbi:MAG: hypothetical protein M9891_16520 [Austwickia sp.]|nr:hypothetical protein [Austwickia sp.]MCO5310857.1 hypothetical protein [Austwickia sp.]